MVCILHTSNMGNGVKNSEERADCFVNPGRGKC